MKRISSVYFFPFLNTYKFQYLWRLGGKQFKMYLSFFSRSSCPRLLSFTGERPFFRIWWEGTCYLLSKILLRSSPPPERAGNRPLYLQTEFFSRASEPGVFWHQISTSSHGDLRPKNWNSLSLFPLTKRVLLPALRLRPIIWLLPPPPPDPVVLLNDLHSLSVHPVMECR